MGKFLVGLIVVSALVGGVAMYYLQVYAYYDEVQVADTTGASGVEIRMTNMATGAPEPILLENFEGIDSDSSPLRFRACFTTSHSIAMLSETFEPYERAEPLTGPSWFECYDAKQIGADLANGNAVAFLGESNITYGFDRVIAVYEDGRAFVWHQINHCGEKVYDGEPAPEGCPPVPERSN